MNNLLSINELKAYLNSIEFPDDAIVTVYDLSDGTRLDAYLGLQYFEQERILDINIGDTFKGLE